MGIFENFKSKEHQRTPSDRKSQKPLIREQADPGRWRVGDKMLDRFEIRDVKWGGKGIV